MFFCLHLIFIMEHVLKQNIYTLYTIMKTLQIHMDMYIYLVLRNTAVETVEKGDKPLVGCIPSSS